MAVLSRCFTALGFNGVMCYVLINVLFYIMRGISFRDVTEGNNSGSVVRF